MSLRVKDARTNTALEAPTTSTEEEQLEQALRASRKEAEAAHGRSGRESELSSDKAFASNMQEVCMSRQAFVRCDEMVRVEGGLRGYAIDGQTHLEYHA